MHLESVFRFSTVINAANGVNGKSVFRWGVGGDGIRLWLQRKGPPVKFLQIQEGQIGFVCSWGGSRK